MYHFVVSRIVQSGFRGLCRGDYTVVTKLMSEHCHYHFVGTHALGGHRNSRAAIERWFQRFLRIFPGFQFVPSHVLVHGWPWQTFVIVKLQVSWQKPDGSSYQNVALQMITLKWFKAVDVLTVDDSQAVAQLLQERAAKNGVGEAVAEPIVD